VLLNLLNNSFDAVRDLQDRWIHIAFELGPKDVAIIFTDSGAGIAEALAEKIMVPFFTTKEVGKGTGLGLSIAKGIVEDHGGTIVLDQDCSNTRFIVTLPFRQTKYS
jgi:C4-dicarboxylate-specific signal transduction histidine kinase